jgi:hypothetical protein
MNSYTATAHTIPPVLIESAIKNDRIECERSDAEISTLVSDANVVVLKNAFDPDAVMSFRHAVNDWSNRTAPYPHGIAPTTTPTVNYHRVDDGKIASALPHIFHQVCFNDIDDLDGSVGPDARWISGIMKDLQNRVAQTTFDFSMTGLRVKVLRYPTGGGYLAEHIHPLEPQRVGLILSLSRIGYDFVEGGTTFRTPRGLVDTNRYHDIGDVIIFRYDLAHGVKAVDPQKQIDWQSEAGKWTMLLELRETHAQSHAKM